MLQNVGTRPQPRTLETQYKRQFPSELRKWGEAKSFATALSNGSVVVVVAVVLVSAVYVTTPHNDYLAVNDRMTVTTDLDIRFFAPMPK
jgi:hypothetical protein